MKRFFKIFLSLIILLFAPNYANALDILFPQTNPYNTWSKVTYIMGNVKKGSKLFINGKTAKVWKNGAFCQTVNLQDGKNTFLLEEKNNDCIQSKTLSVTKNVASQTNIKKTYSPPAKTKFKDLQYATIITDGAPVRSQASTNGKRITHLPVDTIVLIDTKYGNWYKINTGENNEGLWIYNKNVKILYPVNNRIKINIREALTYEDCNFSYLKLNLDLPIAYKTVENGNNIELTLYGIKDFDTLSQEIKMQNILDDLQIKSFENNNLTILIPSQEKLWGYDTDFDKSNLIFKKRKNPEINKTNALEGITIAIDAGHGGKELGTVGPTRIPEKDVNLAIALKVQKELTKLGANVVMTRTADEFSGLYERPAFVAKNNALICISIHANSMVDGDPFSKNGTSVFYYNEYAKELAETIKLSLLDSLKLKDDGTRNASFVLTRPTNPMSILIEVGYMPNPDEYNKLTTNRFQHKAAIAIVKGLKNYILLNAK